VPWFWTAGQKGAGRLVCGECILPDISLSIVISIAAFLVWWGVGKAYAATSLSVPPAARATLAAVWFSLIASYPFWAFGAYSAIGWYDAYDGIIPYEILRAWNPSQAFSHAYAGGSDIESIFFLGGAPWSLYVGLIRLIGPQLGSLVFTLGALISLFMGVYWTARRVFGVDHLPATFGALTAFFVMQYSQTGVLGGLGWNFSVMVWLGLLALSPMAFWARLAFAAALALIAAATTTIGFFLPTGFFYVIALLIGSGHSWRKVVMANFIPSILFVTIDFAFNYELLHNLMQHTAESSRYLGIRSVDALEAWAGGSGEIPPISFADMLKDNSLAAAHMFLSGVQLVKDLDLQRISLPPTVLYLAGLAVGLVYFPSKLWRLAAAVAFLVLSAFVLTLTLGQTSIPVLSDFRWHELFTSTMPLLGLSVAVLLAQVDASVRPTILRGVTYGWLLLLLILSMSIMAHRTLETVAVYGGWRMLGGYEESLNAAKTGERQRAASYKANSILGVFNGIDVLDGMRQNFSPSRTAFWFLALHRDLPDAWHTHRHDIPADWGDADLNMLRMANVGLVLSNQLLSVPELQLVARQKAVSLKEAASDPWTRLIAEVINLRVLPELAIYRIDDAWPRVFVPAQVTVSAFGIDQRQYYQELKAVDHLEILFPKGNELVEGTDSSHLVLGEAHFTTRGMEIVTRGTGVLVYNQEYNRDWRAYCEDGQSVAISPVSAIMMAVSVPDDCGRMSFEASQRH